MKLHDFESGHELTYDERARWGVCPVCGAKSGDACDPQVGISIGANIYGHPPPGGAHLGRLQLAPLRVRLVRA